MYCGDEVNAIVGDIGTSISKFGFAGEDTPKLLFGGQVGKAPGDAAYAITDNELSHRRAGLAVTHAVRDGLWADWDAVEAMWGRAFKMLHAKDSHVAHSVVAAEAAWATAAQREKFIQLMFEKFDVPALYIAPNPVLAAFAAGRQSALVVDCGGGGTSVVPVVDGFALRKPQQRSRRGGDWLDAQVRDVVEQQMTAAAAASGGGGGAATTAFKVHPRYSISRKRKMQPPAADVADSSADGSGGSGGGSSSSSSSSGGGGEKSGGGGGDGAWATSITAFPDTHASYERRAVLEVSRGLKEAICGLPLARFEDAGLAHHLPVPGMAGEYELPDGSVVKLSPQLYRVPERLFDDEIVTPEQAAAAAGGGGAAQPLPHTALQKMVHRCVSKCDGDVRKEMIGNVLLTGAGSQFKYFPERLQREVTAIVPSSFKVKVVCPEKIERRFGVWIGGSILSSLGSFQQMWLSKAEFEELGSSRAERRFAM